jgi:hypothetical protein
MSQGKNEAPKPQNRKTVTKNKDGRRTVLGKEKCN